MRVAQVTATFPPYRGGTGNAVEHTARALQARGHDVTVLTARAADRDVEPFPFRVQSLPAMLRLGNAPLTPGLLKALDSFDLIHLHCPYIFGAELTAAAAGHHRIPLIVTYHHDLRAPGVRGAAFRLYEALVYPGVLRGAGRVLATSHDYAAHSRLARLGVPVVELPIGVDASAYRPGMREPGERPYVLFVGGMDRAHYFKGVPILLSALRMCPDLSAVLAGDGNLRREYERDARSLGDRVRFVGSVSGPELIRLYQGAAVTVLPSTTAGEAFGLVLLESLACGTPVIASDLPGVRTVVEDGVDGLLAPPGDPVALAQALSRLTGHPLALRSMGAAGRRKVEARYRWECISERLEQIYLEVLGHALPAPGRAACAS